MDTSTKAAHRRSIWYCSTCVQKFRDRNQNLTIFQTPFKHVSFNCRQLEQAYDGKAWQGGYHSFHVLHAVAIFTCFSHFTFHAAAI